MLESHHCCLPVIRSSDFSSPCNSSYYCLSASAPNDRRCTSPLLIYYSDQHCLSAYCSNDFPRITVLQLGSSHRSLDDLILAVSPHHCPSNHHPHSSKHRVGRC
ncbi:hypothetical protein GW17_00052145 [Ensete ventricosum]|nr:hypothetical protein GW17_00052145 [Ensete ventricosum]